MSRAEADRHAPIEHGVSAYANGVCRCDLCTWAWGDRARVRRGKPSTGGAPSWFDAWANSAGSL